MGKRKVGSATNPRTVLVRVSSAHANRVAFFIESIKVARVPYSDSPRFPGVRIYCRTRIICSSTGIGCVGSWLTHGMLVTVEAMGLPPFPALVCHLFSHCIVCVLLSKHLLASSPCIPWFHNQDGYRIAFP